MDLHERILCEWMSCVVGQATEWYGARGAQLRMANTRAENAERRVETAEREERRHMNTAKKATADLHEAQRQQADAEGAHICAGVLCLTRSQHMVVLGEHIARAQSSAVSRKAGWRDGACGCRRGRVGHRHCRARAKHAGARQCPKGDKQRDRTVWQGSYISVCYLHSATGH